MPQLLKSQVINLGFSSHLLVAIHTIIFMQLQYINLFEDAWL